DIDAKVDNVLGDDDTFNAVITHVMEGLAEQFISSPNEVADRVEGNISGFADTTGSNGKLPFSSPFEISWFMN
ncbi:Hypothetical predicted protein, partial [Olea europaea subsp. europaea]